MRKVLLICPYDNIFPPMNGGMQRCFHIINQLSKYVDLTIIIHQEKASFLASALIYPSVGNIHIYSTKDEIIEKDIFNFLPIKLQASLKYRWIKKRIIGSADGNFLKYYRLLKMLLISNKFDSILLENLSTLNAVSFIKTIDKKIKIIYDAHNVDSNLAFEEYTQNKIKKKCYTTIKIQESNLYKYVNKVLVCSDADKVAFETLNENKVPIDVVPNGVEIHSVFADVCTKAANPQYLLFCGSLNYAPNVEGLIWFYKNCWHTIKATFTTLKFIVVGSGDMPSSLNELKNDSSIIFTGPVPSVAPYYLESTIAIAPLLSGSGTRLKILEAMSYGLPVISTSKGAEGINYTNDINIIIADNSEKFAMEIINILDNKNKHLSILNAARILIKEQYDWNIIGKNLSLSTVI